MNAHDVLKYGQLTLLGCLEGVPESEWETPGVCGVWSVKQIVAHLASYEAVLADALSEVSGNGQTPALDRYRTDPAGFNDAEVDARAGLSPADARADLDAEHARAMVYLRRLSPEIMRKPGTIPWYGTEYSLNDLLVYMNYGHKREHCAQIERFRDHGMEGRS